MDDAKIKRINGLAFKLFGSEEAYWQFYRHENLSPSSCSGKNLDENEKIELAEALYKFAKQRGNVVWQDINNKLASAIFNKMRDDETIKDIKDEIFGEYLVFIKDEDFCPTFKKGSFL